MLQVGCASCMDNVIGKLRPSSNHILAETVGNKRSMFCHSTASAYLIDLSESLRELVTRCNVSNAADERLVRLLQVFQRRFLAHGACVVFTAPIFLNSFTALVKA